MTAPVLPPPAQAVHLIAMGGPPLLFVILDLGIVNAVANAGASGIRLAATLDAAAASLNGIVRIAQATVSSPPSSDNRASPGMADGARECAAALRAVGRAWRPMATALRDEADRVEQSLSLVDDVPCARLVGQIAAALLTAFCHPDVLGALQASGDCSRPLREAIADLHRETSIYLRAIQPIDKRLDRIRRGRARPPRPGKVADVVRAAELMLARLSNFGAAVAGLVAKAVAESVGVNALGAALADGRTLPGNENGETV